MDDLEPGVRRAWAISNVVSLTGIVLVLLGAVVRRPWTFIPAGVGGILVGADFIYSRRFLTLGWGPAARERLRPATWHRWFGGITAIVAGCWMLLEGVLR